MVVNRPGRGIDNQIPSVAGVKHEYGCTSIPLLCPYWRVTGRPLPLHINYFHLCSILPTSLFGLHIRFFQLVDPQQMFNNLRAYTPTMN